MWKRERKVCAVLVVVVAMHISWSTRTSALYCDDKRCKTGECDEDGQCICNLPHSSSILDGDRPFLGGKFCDEEQVMCDGTNSFWCEHGGVCEEIIQGENYTCKCSPGYIGEHCQHGGTSCGNTFCFHQAECIEENSECACHPHWKGSVDCSLPTKIKHTLNDTTPNFVTTNYRGGHNEWLLPFVSVVIAVGVLGSVVSWTKKFYIKKREAETMKFQQLSEVQSHGFLDTDNDDDDSLIAPQLH